jgi:hypothetical protein
MWLHRVSLWLLCDGAALRGIVSAVDCSCVCVSLRCVHSCVTAALGGAPPRWCACVVGGGGGDRWQSMLRTSATRVLLSCMSQSQCRTAVLYEPVVTTTSCCTCYVCPWRRCRRCCSRLWAGVQCRAAVVCHFRGDEHIECAVYWSVYLRRCVFGCLCVCYTLIAVSGSVLAVRVCCCAAVLLRCCVAALLCCSVAVSLCRCVAMFGTALHWTAAAAVSGSSRAAAVAMHRSLRSGCGAIS